MREIEVKDDSQVSVLSYWKDRDVIEQMGKNKVSKFGDGRIHSILGRLCIKWILVIPNKDVEWVSSCFSGLENDT